MTRFVTLSMFATVSLIFPNPASVPAQDTPVRQAFQPDTLLHLASTVIQTATPSQSGDNSETTWRRTRFGWEDSRYWEPVTVLRPEPMPGIHPLAWAGLLTLSVLVMLIWASEEDEVAQLAPTLISAHNRRTATARAEVTERTE